LVLVDRRSEGFLENAFADARDILSGDAAAGRVGGLRLIERFGDFDRSPRLHLRQ